MFHHKNRPRTVQKIKQIHPFQKKSDPEKSKKSKWWLDAYVSPELSSNQNFQPAEKPKFSFSAGFRLNRSFGRHFSAKTGVQFEWINYADSLGIHHLNAIDLPLLIGYSFGNKNFKTTLNAGTIFNIYSWSGGTADTLNHIFKSSTGWSLIRRCEF